MVVVAHADRKAAFGQPTSRAASGGVDWRFVARLRLGRMRMVDDGDVRWSPFGGVVGRSRPECERACPTGSAARGL